MISFRGTRMHLSGTPPRAGEPAPDFVVTTDALAPFTMQEAIDHGARNALLIAVPSLDTATCDAETKTFARRAGEVPAGTAPFVISMDLPFAQRRWAAANGAEALAFLSDYRDRSFGRAYGIVIEELGLLARAVFVVAKNGTIAYAEIVPEVSDEPDYDATLAALARLV